MPRQRRARGAREDQPWRPRGVARDLDIAPPHGPGQARGQRIDTRFNAGQDTRLEGDAQQPGCAVDLRGDVPGRPHRQKAGARGVDVGDARAVALEAGGACVNETGR